MLLVDKYRPQTLEKLDYHVELAKCLKSLASSDDLPHLLFYGPNGAGKKTRIMALLRQIFGQGVEKLKVEKKSFEIPNKSEQLEISAIFSAHHIELSPCYSEKHDKLVVEEVIKEIAKNQQIDFSADSRPFKVVILNEVDYLSRAAQHALRRTMEKYMNNCRIIMCATNLSGVIEALRSRTLCLRIPAPTSSEVVKILKDIAKQESFVLPEEFANRIAVACKRNLRRAILMLEMAKIRSYPFQNNQPLEEVEWEKFICSIALLIVKQQSPAQLLVIREKFYELITHCIPAELIMKNLVYALLEHSSSRIRCHVIKWASEYEHRIKISNTPIIHLEAFTAKFMELYKTDQISSKS